jgi:hypothetical protein
MDKHGEEEEEEEEEGGGRGESSMRCTKRIATDIRVCTWAF